MTRRALILTLLLSLVIPMITFNNLFGQEINENNFVQYTTAQGLSQNTITGIAQDSTGYIWASTTLGLNRFNGTKFIQFHSTDDSLSLPGEMLTGMTWLDKHRLAVFTGGAHIIDTRTTETKNIFIPYHDKQYAYKFNSVIAGQGNEDGDIFLLTRSGFYHFNKSCQLVFRFDYYTAEQTQTTGFGFGRDLLWIDVNHLLITSTYGLYLYDIARRIFKKMTPSDCPVLGQFTDYPAHDYEFFQSIPGIFFIMDSNDDSLIYINVAENKKVLSQIPFTKAREHFDYRSEILTVNDTLIYITDNTSGFYKIRLYPSTGKVDLIPKKYFPTYYCRHLIEDRNHHLWIATTKGLFREDNRRSNVTQGTLPPSLEVDFPKITLDGIEGTSNYLFAATLGDAGVLEFDKQQKFIRRFSFGKSVKDADNISSVAAADDNTLLVGTNGPLYQLNLQTNLITKIPLENWIDGKDGKDWIADLYRDRNRNIWIAASSLYKYDAITKKVTLIPSNGKMLEKIQRPNSIKQDAEGNIWVSGHGLVRFNTRSNTFDRIVDSFPYIKLPDRQVNAFTADQQNNLWINSNNNGLICYNTERQTFRQFTRDDGLPDNNIASMIVIGNKLWIAAYAGIACMDLNTYRITNFGK
ncbi:MAG: two-component regulator propeller domain-containing protein, partial [Chitinophagaceae bacterium]